MDRPHTSNPKRKASAEVTPVHNPPGLDLKPLAPDDMREILWSEEQGVPENILARPHTSNPRYVEMHMRDTPRKDGADADGSHAAAPASAGPTSATPSSDHNSVPPPQQPEGILWACGDDMDTIDPALLVRPVTANPWLTRLFESGNIPAEANRGSKILWSSNDIEDWRSLARPHTSNPHRERDQEVSEQDAVVDEATHSVPTAANVSEVLWAREDPEEMRGTIEAQGRRIMNLEEEVSTLKQILYEVIVKLGGQTVQRPPGPAAAEEGARVLRPSTPLPENVPQAAAAGPAAAPAAIEGPAASAPEVHRPPQVPPSKNSPTARPQRAEPSKDVAPALSPAPVATPASKMVTPIRQSHAADDDDGFVVEDTSAVEPQLLGPTTPTALRPTAPPAPGSRPDTATGSRRVLELRETVGHLRPQSAPLSQYTQITSRRRDVVNCFSGEGYLANHLDNGAIATEYARLLRRGHDLVLRQDFKEHYMEKAADMGMFVNKAEVDRKFGNSPQYLTLEEFAIHYLRIARW